MGLLAIGALGAGSVLKRKNRAHSYQAVVKTQLK
jgi:hypothetical protein